MDMRLINGNKLFEDFYKLEAQALKYVDELIERDGEDPSVEWKIWSAILYERTAYKHDILDAPTIEAEPIRHGKWIFIERREPQYDISGVKTWGIAYRCSECGFVHSVIENFGHYTYCPHCGAKMDEVTE